MAKVNSEERVFKGIAASPGIAQGRAFVFLQKKLDIPFYKVDPSKSSYEIKRFEEALVKTRGQISGVRSEVAIKLSEEEAQIFDAHLLVLEDMALIEETTRLHAETLNNIDYCFHQVVKRYIDAFDKIDDEYIQERSTDIRDVAKRLLENLLGERRESLVELTNKHIIVSEDLSPSDTASLSEGFVLGIATDSRSRTSHAVIMARSFGVPVVVGLGSISEDVKTEDFLIVDGYEGVVIVNPAEATLKKYRQFQEERNRIQDVFIQCKNLPSETLDKQTHPILLNVSGSENLERLSQLNADGVGLFRTEGLFLQCEAFLSEEDQYQYYLRVVQAMKGKPTVIRTLDLGGDKQKGSLFYLGEKNPFLGFRAIRFCLEHKELFKDQLKAILRTSAHGKVKIMYPMISGAEELIAANEILKEAKIELKERGASFDPDIEVGIMIEIPSSVMIIDLLKPHCSFVSIGTNDLVQYLLAVDRLNEKVAGLYNPAHPAVLRTLKFLIESCQEYNLEVNVCGEMAGDVLYMPILLGLGVNKFSLTPSVFAEIKYLMRSITFEEAHILTQEVMQFADPEKTAKHLKAFYFDKLHEAMTEEA